MQDTAQDRKQEWRAKFEAFASNGGFFEELGSQHKALFVEQGKILVVAFENLDDARQDINDRLPWGMNFLTSHGWSALGVMAHGPTWYRDPAVYDFFDRLRDEQFFEKFDRVVFYGASMGGYAATAYAASCPGADVIVVNPQATLSRDVTIGWESRFKLAWRRDFNGRYGYGPDGVKAAGKVRLFYDPAIRPDAIHAALYTGDNIEKIRCRHMGHGMLSTWRHMGVLTAIVKGCIEGTSTRTEIYAHLTARKRNTFYQKQLLGYLLQRKRPFWVRQYSNAVVQDSKPKYRPYFKRAMIDAQELLNRS